MTIQERAKEIVCLEDVMSLAAGAKKGWRVDTVAVKAMLDKLSSCETYADQGRLDFAVTVERIRQAPRVAEQVDRWLTVVVAYGRYCKSDQKVPNRLWWKGRSYIPVFAKRDKSPGQKVLESELTKLVSETKLTYRKNLQKQIAEFLQGSNRLLNNLANGKNGVYSFLSRNCKGAGRVMLAKGKIAVLDGIGSLGWMRGNKGVKIPYLSFIHRSTPKGDPEYRDIASRLLVTLSEAVGAYNRKKK